LLPASTVQILGAEKALFRHLKTGAKPPRHGFIIEHSLISNASQKEHGRRARALATKISIAARVDFFKGKFIGEQLRKDLEARFQ
jgi:nucleolar protein 56